MSDIVFRCNFAEHLRFGHVLELSGRAKKEAKRFLINLKAGEATADDDSNIGLQISVNFLKDMILFKKYINGEWCDEESKGFDTSQFTKEFRIYIVMADEKFHISINNALEISYKYRLRLGLLTQLEIDGDLETVCQVDHRKYFPVVWPPIQVFEERLHFSGDVPMPFKVGHVMVIGAELSGSENGSFIVHLRNINDVEMQEFHLRVAFKNRRLCWNTKTIPNGEHFRFGEEHELDRFPFEEFLQPFKLAFAFGENELKLAKDGVFLFSISYRSPDILPLIGGLKIFGLDGLNVRVAELQHVQMEDVSCAGFENYSQLEIVNNLD
uniref:Galectin n=1 Tax=Musca domestica TaxID=7370 RepID=A0A1I8N2D1_MUSDO